MKKASQYLSALLCSVLILCSCAQSTDEISKSPEITALSFSGMTDIHLELTSAAPFETGYVRAEKSDDLRLRDGDVLLRSDNEEVVSAEVTKTSSSLVAYKITALSVGEADVYAETPNGEVTSLPIHVTVTDKNGITSTEDVTGDTTQTDTDPSSDDPTGSEQTRESAIEVTDDPASDPVTTDTEPKQTSAMTENISQTSTAVSYTLNTKTKKIHLPSCSFVSRIKEENLGTTEDPDSLLAEGYAYCKTCCK